MPLMVLDQPINIYNFFSVANYFWGWTNKHEILYPTQILREITNYRLQMSEF